MIGERDEYEIQCDLIQRIISEQQPLEIAMRDAIEVVKPGLSDESYIQLQEIDFGTVLVQSEEWIRYVLETEPPPMRVFAFWFGMFDTSDGSGDDEWQQMYISGADRFEVDDEGEWACGCYWEPNSRYPNVPELEFIGKLCPFRENQAGFTLSNSLVTALAVNHAKIFSEVLGFKRGLFGRRKHSEYPIACGHDAGDCVVVGYATSDGLRRPT